MQAEDAADVRELLQYEENTAGGIMTNDYMVLEPTLTVGEALARLRQPDVPEFTYYLYVVDEAETLLGAVSLRALLASVDDQLVVEVMTPAADLITAHVNEPAHDVAEEMLRYNLLAMPVLEDKRLEGIVLTH